MNTATLLTQTATTYPDRIAVRCGDRAVVVTHAGPIRAA